MGFITKRREFNKLFCKDCSKQYERPYGEAELYADLNDLAEQVQGIRLFLWQYFESRGQKDLP